MQTFFFIAFPYIALILAVGVGLYRYFSHRFTYSSVSSQLLENRHLFWGSVSWHYGITLILVAHVLPWLFPRAAAAVLGDPTRLSRVGTDGLGSGFLLCVRYCRPDRPAAAQRFSCTRGHVTYGLDSTAGPCVPGSERRRHCPF